jgi:hypothetical protein
MYWRTAPSSTWREWCQARRASDRPTHQVRASHQPQDRESPQLDDPAVAACASRPGDRVACSTNAANSSAQHSSARLPPAILHRGAHAADRARGRSRFPVMNRRTFLRGLTLGTLPAPFAAEGQPGPALPRIGVLTLSVAFSTPTFQAFRQGLRDQGYVEGQNIALELRFANGSPETLAAMATDLVRKKVEVIVTESVLAAREARNATATTPIVTAIHGDPVGAGLAASTRTGWSLSSTIRPAWSQSPCGDRASEGYEAADVL